MSPRGGDRVDVAAPGRVNLIGDHTDTTGGLVCPMAVDRFTTLRGRRGGDEVRLRSTALPGEAVVPLDVADPSRVSPPWARYVAGVVASLRPTRGLVGELAGDLPVGSGLSSSASLQVALALALGWEGDALDLAERIMASERSAAGVPCGPMDPLAVAAGRAGHALRIDCTARDVRAVALPAAVQVLIVDGGVPRRLADGRYARRRAEAEAAVAALGCAPVDADDRAVAAVGDELLRRRARHVVTENRRVDEFVTALGSGDVARAGRLMTASHESLSRDMEVSTPALDARVAELVGRPGVLGARLTGAGFGGWLVALVAAHTSVPGGLPVQAVDGALRVSPSDPAS